MTTDDHFLDLRLVAYREHLLSIPIRDTNIIGYDLEYAYHGLLRSAWGNWRAENVYRLRNLEEQRTTDLIERRFC